MPEQGNPEHAQVASMLIDRVTVTTTRRRAMGDISALAGSIEDLGLLQPIVVTPAGALVSGRHRLAACELLGWESIPVRVMDFDDIGAQIAEIDENLVRNDLDTLERAQHLRERKPLYEAAYPETKKGQYGGHGKATKLENENISFSSDTANKTGVTARSVQMSVKLAEDLDDEAQDLLAGLPIANNGSQLRELAALPAEEQREVASVLREAKAPVVDALEMARMEPEKRAEVVDRVNQGERAHEAIAAVAGKKITHVSHNSGENEWYTPVKYLDAARRVLGAFDVDPASSPLANEQVGAETFYTADDDGLAQEWRGRVWMNPPYAAGLVDKFAVKLVTEISVGRATSAIVLVNNATETRWFRVMADKAAAICFPAGRVRFVGVDGAKGAPLQGQAVLYFGEDVDVFVDVFAPLGLVLVAP